MVGPKRVLNAAKGTVSDVTDAAEHTVRDATSEADRRVRELGTFIRDQRQAAELSGRNLAQRAGVSNPYLSQIERGLRKPSAEILAQAGLDEQALQCPPAWPADLSVRAQLTQPTRLSHNCSGKHAAMLWAHNAIGADPRSYLASTSDLQQHIATVLERIVAEPVLGPGVDGCGAPAWRCSLAGMAQGFARLVAGYEPGLIVVRNAMMQLPQLVGGMHLADTQMMLSDGRIVAKRGAEGVMVAAFDHPCHGPLGLAVKVLDGSDRAAGPLAAGILHALGAAVDEATRRPPVLGGSVVVGAIQATPQVLEATSRALSHLSGRTR